jgi:hypothetical protein
MLRALAEQDLQATQAAAFARAKRQRTGQRVVSKGGLISVGQGRLKSITMGSKRCSSCCSAKGGGRRGRRGST